jgi:hypothetical protein
MARARGANAVMHRRAFRAPFFLATVAQRRDLPGV